MLTDILKCLNKIRADHDGVEIRCIKARGDEIVTGVFDWEHRSRIPAAIASYDNNWAGIYFCLNAPNLPATNKLEHGTAVSDKHISRRTGLLFDFDPVRLGPDGKVLREPALDDQGQPILDQEGKPRMKKMEVSSTAEEKARALQRALACRKYLMDLGWPEPILADSGNGYHLIFYLQMMCINGEDVGVDFDAIYNALANKFGDDEVEFDVKVRNPSRICKLYGTTPRKGPNSGERPWRQSGLMEGREDWASHPVTREMLFAVEELAEASAGAKIPNTPYEGKEISDEEFRSKVAWVWNFLNDNPKAKVLSRPQRDNKGARIDVECPLAMEHSADSGKRQASILILREYGYDFNCFHDHADARRRGEIMDWAWFRKQVESEDLGVIEVEEADNTPEIEEEFQRPDGEDIPEDNKVIWIASADELDEIRKGKKTYIDKEGNEKTAKLAPHLVDERILHFVVKTLKKSLKSRFFVDGYPYIFVPNENVVYKFHNDNEAHRLLSRLHLRINQRHCELVKNNLALHILTYGEQTRIEKWGCMRGEAVYVNNGRGGIIKITTDDITEVQNGTDNVFMIAPELQPWPALDREKMAKMAGRLGGYGGKVTDTPLCHHFNALFDEGQLLPAQYHQLVILRYLSLFLGNTIELHPLMLATGVQNAGKSTLWEKIMWLLTGVNYMSAGLPQDIRSFVANITNYQLKVFDNIDSVNFSNPKSDYPTYLDYMCKCASGGTIGIAELYKTNVELTYSLRCDIFLTARENPFPANRSDVSRRTLFFPIRLPTAEEYITVENMKAALVRDSDDMKFETLMRLQLLLRALLGSANRTYKPESEMHSYETYTMRVADFEGWRDEMAEIWRGYYKEYQEKVSRDSPLVDFIRCWLCMDSANPGRWVRAGQIYKALSKRYGQNVTRQWRNAASFGRELAKIRSALMILGIEKRLREGNIEYALRPTDDQMLICRNTFHDTEVEWTKPDDDPTVSSD